jgi:hypothetical protein
MYNVCSYMEASCRLQPIVETHQRHTLLFAYLTTLSVAQIIRRRMDGMINERRIRMSVEAVGGLRFIGLRRWNSQLWTLSIVLSFI